MTTRRSFLGQVLAAFLVPPAVPLLASREEILAQALRTPEGRARLAAAMAAPIRTTLDYRAMGRKVLGVGLSMEARDGTAGSKRT